MARNKLSDLNNHLFAQIERLTDEGMKDADFNKEINRSIALSKLADQVVKTHKVALDAIGIVKSSNPEIDKIQDAFNYVNAQLTPEEIMVKKQEVLEKRVLDQNEKILLNTN